MERAETTGLAVAVVGHSALIAALLVGLGRAEAPAPPQPVEVSIVAETALEASSPSQEATQQATSPDPAPLSETEPDSPAPDPAPATLPEPVPAPRPEPRPEPKADPKPEPRPVERPAPKPRPKPAPTPPAKSAPKPAAKPVAKPPPKAAARPVAPTQSAASGSATAAKPARTAAATPRGGRLGSDFLKGVDSASEGRAATPPAPIKSVTPAVQRSLAQAVARKIKPHWRAPPGVDAEMLVSRIGFNLSRDGRVIGRPRLLGQTGRNDSNAPQAPLHAEAAIAAVMAAQPFDLPADYYEEWKDVQFTFDRKL